MDSLYLSREDVETLKQLFQEFPDQNKIEVTSDTSSGIGAIVKATFHNVPIFGKPSSITFTLADEENW